MKIKVKKVFRYQATASKLKALQPGVYEVGVDITQYVADLALKYGKSEVVKEAPKVVEKKAPENKVVEAPENKIRVVKKPVRRRSARTKPDE